MKLIKVAAAVLNQTPLDWEGNKQNIIRAIRDAKQQQVSLLCLPELCISGYGCEDAFYAPDLHKTAIEVLPEILPETKGIAVCLGLPIALQNKLFNTACLVSDGNILGFVAKRFLAGNGVYYEPRWFTPWKNGERSSFEIEGVDYPIGDFYFNVGGVKIGFEICEDAWVANRPGRYLYDFGVDIIMNPSASHFAFGKLNIRKRFVLEGSRAFGVGYIYANLLGNDAGRMIFDGGALIASNGELQAVGPRLTFEDCHLTTAILDVEINRLTQLQNRTPFEHAAQEDECIRCDFEFPQIAPQHIENEEAAWEYSPFIKEEEFARAVSLALFDYMRKSYSRGFVISLSGGADSAAVSCLCRLMIDLGIQSIGWEQFTDKLSYIQGIKEYTTEKQLARRLITCVYQASKNSGSVTRNAAEALAEALHATYYFLFVGNIVENYEAIIAESLGRPLTWEQDDIARQNIQARVRAPSVWMLANIKGALLLSTSNRSEAAVGYATMDGDTSGGLSPIAGIDKAFLRKWLRWLETEGLNKGEITIPELIHVNAQQPTAELRPQESKQTDEGDLMPYDLLDEVEELAIRDKKPPLECFLLLRFKFPQYSDEQLKIWTDKFFKLWCRNQWKRERYAPSFHLDDKNLDPKTWCRFPILSGGFARELKEMWAYVG
ncbi:MAG: NAD(+) synthase [Microscillaceae bacterium]|nr:NAD(+) synthase [Microscillaceae bacterium]